MGQILQEFKEGKIDVLINIAQSEERHRYTDFSVPHVIDNGAIFVLKDESRIHSEADFAGKSIIVFKSDLAHEYAISRGWQKQLTVVDTPEKGLLLLASGQHDAMLLSKLAGVQALRELHIENIQVLDAKAGYSQKLSFGVHSGDTELLARLNDGLAITKSDGDYDAIYDRWFGIYEDKRPTFVDMLPYIASVVIFS
jgi:polar amino acid transport system substrate-binding protein